MSNSTKRGFCTQFESHKGLIHRMARKGYGRLMDLNITVDYEDVFQEMSLAYAKAAQKYDANKGITFSAYLGRTIWNEFNNFVENELNNHTVSLEDLRHEDDGESEADLYEVIAGSWMSPEELLEKKQEFQNKSERSNKLTRYLIGQLLNPSARIVEAFENEVATNIREGERVPYDITAAFILKCNKKFDEKTVKETKRQLKNLYGITLRQA